MLPQELDLDLRRVDVHIHQMLRQPQLQHAVGIAPDHQPVAVGLLERGGHRLRAHQPPVDEKDLLHPVAARGRRARDIAREREALPFALHGDHLAGALPPQNGVKRALELPVAGGLELLGALAQHAEGDLGMRQRQLLHGGQNGRALDGVALHEFQACGGVIEQIADDDRRAHGTPGLAALGHDAAVKMQRRAEIVFASAREQIDARNGGDRRQRLAAEAQRADRLEILRRAQLACGVAQEGRLGVLGAHAAAVVRDAQEGHAAVLQLDRDVLRPGIDRVLDQLLGGAGRTFDHLAGSDHVGDLLRQLLNDCHCFLLFHHKRVAGALGRDRRLRTVTGENARLRRQRGQTAQRGTERRLTAAREIRPPPRASGKDRVAGEQRVAAEQAHRACRMPRRFEHAEAQRADRKLVALVQRTCLRQRPAGQPRRERPVCLMQIHRAVVALRERSGRADVVKMAVREQDAARRQAAALQKAEQPVRLVSRVDHGRLAVFVGDKITIFLKHSDRNFPDFHLNLTSNRPYRAGS